MAKSFDELVRRTTSKQVQQRAARRTRRYLAEMLLAEIRKLSGKSQKDLADILGIRQPSLSKLENQDDMQISTLKRIIEALGGHLDIIARFPKADVRVDQFDNKKRNAVREVRELELV